MTNLINHIKDTHYFSQDAVEMRAYKGLRKIDAYLYYFFRILMGK